jgi:predicted unusual protein kinase regulating ubiquinone biosynthesis (AarF/ABC1/UbiB family)
MNSTNPKLSDLIRALPDETDEASPIAEERLRAIMAELAGKPAPTSALQRLWTLGGLSAEVALAYLALWMRQWFADADQRARQEMETNLRIALRLFRRLGYMRGAMTKVGQALGSFPDLLPDEIVETLDRLHFEAPPMHFSLLGEVVVNELGSEPEGIFAEFDREPFASASLGQVHRARLRSGEQVAVKIQYPGIARTIAADFRNLTALMLPMRLGSQWESLKGFLEEIRRMLTLEADYRHEAGNLERARPLFSEDDGIVVPRLYAQYSTERVLTTEFLPGKNLGDFMETQPAQEARDALGLGVYRAFLRMAFAHMSYGDPHVGNYIAMPDGRLGLVDFGCVQNFDAGERELMKLSEAFIEDRKEFPEFLRRACYFNERDFANEDYVAAMERSVAWFSEPYTAEQPFDFGNPERLRRGLQQHAYLARKRYTKSHPMFVYQARSGYGLATVLYRLGARIDMNRLAGEEITLRNQ